MSNKRELQETIQEDFDQLIEKLSSLRELKCKIDAEIDSLEWQENYMIQDHHVYNHCDGFQCSNFLSLKQHRIIDEVSYYYWKGYRFCSEKCRDHMQHCKTVSGMTCSIWGCCNLYPVFVDFKIIRGFMCTPCAELFKN